MTLARCCFEAVEQPILVLAFMAMRKVLMNFAERYK